MRNAIVVATIVLSVLGGAYGGYSVGYRLGFEDGATWVLDEIGDALRGPGTSI